MPVIILDGCHRDKVIQLIHVDVHVRFKNGFSNEYRKRSEQKLKELEKELGEVMEKYFPDYGSDILTDREYKEKMFS